VGPPPPGGGGGGARGGGGGGGGAARERGVLNSFLERDAAERQTTADFAATPLPSLPREGEGLCRVWGTAAPITRPDRIHPPF
jgi:hypothetical protein